MYDSATTTTTGETTDACPPGEAGCPCDAGTCVDELVCDADVCVPPSARCGDGVVDPGEACDDGNGVDEETAPTGKGALKIPTVPPS